MSGLTKAEWMILTALDGHEVEGGQLNGREMYAAQLVPPIKSGSVYQTLARMQAKGLLSSRRQKREGFAGPPLRLYKPTVMGCKALRESSWALTVSEVAL